ncbi:MAG: hypothetical protein ACK4MR_05240, partial [Erythrobacter cryptus]
RWGAVWVARGRLLASLPQVNIGAEARAWLAEIEAAMPEVASAPVGRPAFDETALNARAGKGPRAAP